LPKKTPGEWVLIRADYESGEFTQKALAAKWDISQSSITTHRNKGGWMNPRTGEAWGPTPIQKAETEPVPDGEVAASMNKERVDAALDDIKTKILEDEAPDDELGRMAAELADVKAELAALKPVPVEWPIDLDSAARMAADEIDDRVQMELNNINDDRLRRGLPHWTVAQQDEQRPGWSESIRQGIYQDMVDNLTQWSAPDGGGKYKIDMKGPDGRVEQVPVETNIDGGKRPEKLRARGWRDVTPQSCHRWDCYGPILKGDPWNGFHSELHMRLFERFHPSQKAGVTTSGEFKI